MVVTLFAHICKFSNKIYSKIFFLVIMVIERIIFLYNPLNRKKELITQKEINDAQKEDSFEPILGLKKLNSIEEIKNEEEEHKDKELFKSMVLFKKSDVHHVSFTKKIVIENIFKYPLFYKFLFQIFLLVCVGYFVFIFMPTNGTHRFYPLKHNLDGTVYLIKGNQYLNGFYFLYCIYFLISALQIK